MLDKATPMAANKKKKDFQWMNNESELLLNVTHDYKVAKAATSVDWESVKNKKTFWSILRLS